MAIDPDVRRPFPRSKADRPGRLGPLKGMAVFSASTYVNFPSAVSAAQERLFLQYIGPREDFDIIVVGQG